VIREKSCNSTVCTRVMHRVDGVVRCGTQMFSESQYGVKNQDLLNRCSIWKVASKPSTGNT
jgi:hypothetical protein